MIRFRHTLERARRHPLLGPLVFLLLLLLLVMVAIHAIHDGEHAASDVAPFCLALIAVVALLIPPVGRQPETSIVLTRSRDRGPPRLWRHARRRARGFTSPLVIPLRR